MVCTYVKRHQITRCTVHFLYIWVWINKPFPGSWGFFVKKVLLHTWCPTKLGALLTPYRLNTNATGGLCTTLKWFMIQRLAQIGQKMFDYWGVKCAPNLMGHTLYVWEPRQITLTQTHRWEEEINTKIRRNKEGTPQDLFILGLALGDPFCKRIACYNKPWLCSKAPKIPY